MKYVVKCQIDWGGRLSQEWPIERKFEGPDKAERASQCMLDWISSREARVVQISKVVKGEEKVLGIVRNVFLPPVPSGFDCWEHEDDAYAAWKADVVAEHINPALGL